MNDFDEYGFRLYRESVVDSLAFGEGITDYSADLRVRENMADVLACFDAGISANDCAFGLSTCRF